MPTSGDYTDLYANANPVINMPSYNPANFLPGGNGAYTQGLPNGYHPGMPTTTSGSNGVFGTGIPSWAAGPGLGALSDLTSGNFSVWDAVDPSGLLSSLFGGGKKTNTPGFQPYQDNGQVYSYPSDASHGYANPIPVTNVPGANQTITSEEGAQANQIRSLQDLLPYYLDSINKGNLQSALGNLNTANITSGPYAQLMTSLFNTYGPQLNAIGNVINRQNSLANAETNRQVLGGAGGQTVLEAQALQHAIDPEYYKTRAAASDAITKQLGSIDLNGGLSQTENNEIAQGIARQNTQAGTVNAPSATNAVSNAMQYGNAGRQRVLQNQSLLSQAINNASSFMPSSKSGVDAFQVATGNPSMVNNQGSGNFTGVQNPSQTVSGLSSQLMGNMSELSNQQNQSNMNQANIQANKKDWSDYLSQITGSIGNLAGGAMGALCWVAREVYGNDNLNWLRFRGWLLTKATTKFYNWYRENGEQFAKFISDKPELKQEIKLWMDSKLSTI